jgi:hypothetical protein
VASQIERDIRESLASILGAITWAKRVEPYKIRVGFSEMREHEVPFVQFYGLGQTYEPQRGDLLTRWQIAVDLVLRQGTDGTIDQRDLDDKRQEIIEAIGADPKLGITYGIIHALPVSSTDDLYAFEPFLVSTIVFEMLYRKPFTGDC